MQTMELSRTDQRLDSLDRRVDGTNCRIDGTNCRIDDLSREMHAEFRAVRGEMNTRFDSLHNQMTAMTATMIGGFVTLLAALIATQL
jgi:hypothetical protein